MITKDKVLALAAAVLLTTSSGFAQATKAPASKSAPAPKPAKPTTHTTNGTITSMDASRLVISQKKGGKTEDLTLMLNSSTTKTGDLAPGAKVSVHYRVDNGQNIATSVVGPAAKAAAKPAAKPAASAAKPSGASKAK